MIYLATPYAHPLEEVMHHRYLGALSLTLFLMRQGHAVFSPIVHCHHMKTDLEDWGHDEWLKYDFQLLAKSSKAIFAKLPGWKTSKGMKAEQEFCLSRAIPFDYLMPDNIVPGYILEACRG